MEYLTTTEVARKPKVDASTIRWWLAAPDTQTRRFPNVRCKPGGYARIPKTDVERLAAMSSPRRSQALLYLRVSSEADLLLKEGVSHLAAYALDRDYEIAKVTTEGARGHAWHRPFIAELGEAAKKRPNLTGVSLRAKE